MQEYDIGTDDAEKHADYGDKLAQIRQYLRLIFKKILVFVSFGPGVLGILWLIGRLIKR